MCTHEIHWKTETLMLRFFLVWIIDRWMNRWKQQQNIYRAMKTEDGKHPISSGLEAFQMLGFMTFLFLFFITCLFCFSIQSPSPVPPFPPHLFGSSVWLFIGNDSHCGRAPLRLRSPLPVPPSSPFLQSHPSCIIHGYTIKWGNYGW